MRAQAQSRRIQNTAMKSPSPDIANRNIIKDTRTPIDDVKRYLEKSAQSKSPRVSDLSHSARFSHDNTEVEMLRKRVNELELRSLQQIDQIKKYIHRIERLETEAEAYRQHQSVSNNWDTNNQETDRNNMEKMSEKIYQLLEENQRLGGLLKEKESSILMVTNEYKTLKTQLDNIQSELPQSSQRPSTSLPIGPLLNTNTNQSQESILTIKNYYLEKIEPGMRRTENQIMKKFAELSERMQRIQENQSKVMQQLNKNTPVTPIRQKPSVSPNSTNTGDFNNDQTSGIQPPYNTRPFSSIGGVQSSVNMSGQSGHGGSETNEIIRNLENKIVKLELENENVKKRMQSTEEELSREKELRLLNPIRTNESVENYIYKIGQLEQELEITKTSTQREIISLKEDYKRLEEKKSKEIFLLENEKNTNKKAYDLEKQKTISLEETYSQLIIKSQEIETILQQKEKENNRLKNQIREEVDQKEENIKRYYEDILRNKDRSIGEQLHQYLQILYSIRKDIQEANVEQVVQDAEEAINSRTSIENQIQYIREENQMIINELKRKFIEQEQRIIELEKDNSLLKTEIYELERQKEKLKKTMFDFESYKPTTTTNITTMTTTTTNKKLESGCKLKECLKETVLKINGLEQQITTILME